VSAAPSADTASPCIGICQLEPASGLCRGCRRTIAEIAAWPALAPAERTAILAEIERRKAAPSAP
jgi:predicted Fe-S protein YdhL (DUF1289 family)